MTDLAAVLKQGSLAVLGASALLCGLCLWSYWPNLALMSQRWSAEPAYSHGYLVPLFSVFLLWARRERLNGASPQFTWWGLGLIGVGCLIRLSTALVFFDWLDSASLVVCLAGVVALVGGRQAFMWAWPPIAFLLFMIPLPYRLETALAQPLQTAATLCSTYVIQTLGLPATHEGNIICLPGGKLGVAQACSGLSMLMNFFALATAFVMIIRRPLVDKLIILASAAPIAVVSNVARITVTGLAQEAFGQDIAHKIFHDWAGYLMMPFAGALLWSEMKLLSFVLVEEPLPSPSASPLELDPWTIAPIVQSRKQPKRVLPEFGA
jgi:exosortase